MNGAVSNDVRPAPPDLLDDFAIRVIWKAAGVVVKAARLARSERDEVAQELTLRLLQKLQVFDPLLSHRCTFVATVVDQQAANLIESYATTKQDSRRRRSLSERIPAGEQRVELGDTVLESDRTRHRFAGYRSDQSRFEINHDIAAVLASMPTDLRDICERLMSFAPADVAEQRELTRHAMAEAIRDIRARFEAAGLEAWF